MTMLRLIIVATISDLVFCVKSLEQPTWNNMVVLKKTLPHEDGALPSFRKMVPTQYSRYEIQPGSHGLFSDIAQSIQDRMKGVAKGPFIVVFDFGGIAPKYFSIIEDMAARSDVPVGALGSVIVDVPGFTQNIMDISSSNVDEGLPVGLHKKTVSVKSPPFAATASAGTAAPTQAGIDVKIPDSSRALAMQQKSAECSKPPLRDIVTSSGYGIASVMTDSASSPKSGTITPSTFTFSVESQNSDNTPVTTSSFVVPESEQHPYNEPTGAAFSTTKAYPTQTATDIRTSSNAAIDKTSSKDNDVTTTLPSVSSASTAGMKLNPAKLITTPSSAAANDELVTIKGEPKFLMKYSTVDASDIHNRIVSKLPSKALPVFREDPSTALMSNEETNESIPNSILRKDDASTANGTVTDEELSPPKPTSILETVTSGSRTPVESVDETIVPSSAYTVGFLGEPALSRESAVASHGTTEEAVLGTEIGNTHSQENGYFSKAIAPTTAGVGAKADTIFSEPGRASNTIILTSSPEAAHETDDARNPSNTVMIEGEQSLLTYPRDNEGNDALSTIDEKPSQIPSEISSAAEPAVKAPSFLIDGSTNGQAIPPSETIVESSLKAFTTPSTVTPAEETFMNAQISLSDDIGSSMLNNATHFASSPSIATGTRIPADISLNTITTIVSKQPLSGELTGASERLTKPIMQVSNGEPTPVGAVNDASASSVTFFLPNTTRVSKDSMSGSTPVTTDSRSYFNAPTVSSQVSTNQPLPNSEHTFSMAIPSALALPPSNTEILHSFPKDDPSARNEDTFTPKNIDDNNFKTENASVREPDVVVFTPASLQRNNSANEVISPVPSSSKIGSQITPHVPISEIIATQGNSPPPSSGVVSKDLIAILRPVTSTTSGVALESVNGDPVPSNDTTTLPIEVERSLTNVTTGMEYPAENFDRETIKEPFDVRDSKSHIQGITNGVVKSISSAGSGIASLMKGISYNTPDVSSPGSDFKIKYANSEQITPLASPSLSAISGDDALLENLSFNESSGTEEVTSKKPSRVGLRDRTNIVVEPQLQFSALPTISTDARQTIVSTADSVLEDASSTSRSDISGFNQIQGKPSTVIGLEFEKENSVNTPVSFPNKDESSSGGAKGAWLIRPSGSVKTITSSSSTAAAATLDSPNAVENIPLTIATILPPEGERSPPIEASVKTVNTSLVPSGEGPSKSLFQGITSGVATSLASARSGLASVMKYILPVSSSNFALPSSAAATIGSVNTNKSPSNTAPAIEGERSLPHGQAANSPMNTQDTASGNNPAGMGLSNYLLKIIADMVLNAGVKAIEMPGRASLALLYPDHRVSIANKATNEIMYFTSQKNETVNAADAQGLYIGLKPVTTEISLIIKSRGFNCIPLRSTKLDLNLYVVDSIVFGEGSICGLENMHPSNIVTITKDDEDIIEVTMPLFLNNLTVKIGSIEVRNYYFPIIKGQPIEASVKEISCKGTFSFKKGTPFELMSFRMEWGAISGVHIKMEGALEEGSSVSGVIDNIADALSDVIKMFISPILDNIEKQITKSILES